VAGLDHQPDRRVPGREALEHQWQGVGPDRGGRADDQLAGAAPAPVGDQALALLQGLHGAVGVGQEGAAGVGQAHALAAAREEALAEVALEVLDAGGERRLGHVEDLGGSADGTLAGDLDERGDLAEQHGDDLALWQIPMTTIEKID